MTLKDPALPSATSSDQRDVIEFLSTSATYGRSTGPVERCETHGAIVFLAGDRAYKLKRAVRYPYMDFSTPERRHAMCEAELMVNTRTAPNLYLEVRSIARDSKHSLRFSAAADPAAVDWVVVMRRFQQNALLEQMRQRNNLSIALMRPLAENIVAFHRDVEIRRDFGGMACVVGVVTENVGILRTLYDKPFDPAIVEQYSHLARTMVTRVGDLLNQRREDGYVRRCHGDLHLSNICLIDGQPILFDGIEFNDTFACIDVLYDLAFLLMDLDRHGMRAHANTVLNRYLNLTDEYSGLAALPLFLSCRAAIRAHVAVATATTDSTSLSGELLKEAPDLLRRAVAYLDPLPPRLIAVGGVSGTGKSTLSRSLAPLSGPAPGAVVVRSDVIRKELLGVEEIARLPSGAYSSDMTVRVYDRMFALARRTLEAGHAVIVDAVLGDPEERHQIESIAKKTGVAFDGLWLEAPPQLLEARITNRRGDASDATTDVMRRQLSLIRKPDDWVTIDAATSASEVMSKAARRLRLIADRLA